MEYLQFVEALESMGIPFKDLSPKTQEKVRELQQSVATDEAVERVKASTAKVQTALDAVADLELPDGGLLITRDGEGKLVVAPAKAPKGNGTGAFGGGGGTKVKGPFYYNGKVYAVWHDLAVAELGHKCPAGQSKTLTKGPRKGQTVVIEAGSSLCGYWPKAKALRDSGKVSTTPPPATPAEAPAEVPAPKARSKGKK